VTAGTTLAALRMLGFTERDRMCLRFSFEAPTRRRAVELASELRTIAGNVVQVRPGRPHLRSRRRWTVALKTPPTPLELGAIRHWECEIEAVAVRCSDCRYVGWEPALDPCDVNRIVLRSGA
jgi:hypothetical protein